MTALDTPFPPVSPPDTEAAAAARARQSRLTKPPGSLGRLEDLSVWAAACQGVCPPKQFERARIVVFAGDHGVARHGVSAYPPEVTAQMVLNFLAGGAAVSVLARQHGLALTVVDCGVTWTLTGSFSSSPASLPISDGMVAEKKRF